MTRAETCKESGFIALISAIIIAAILIVITFALSTTGFFLRFNTLDSEFKKISLGLADACVNQALLDIAKGAPVFPKTVNIDANSCKICNINTSVTPHIVQTRAVYKNTYSNVTVNFTKDSYNNFTINSWQETPVNPNSTCTVP